VKPVSSGQIADILYAVKTGPVNFFIYKNGDDCIALDSGLSKPIIMRELTVLGINPASVSSVFLSHTDFDHIGGLQVFPNATIYLSHEEEQLITGKTARKSWCVYNKRLKRPCNLLKDGDIVKVGAVKIKALETPGHTVGSMSYIVDDKILYVGDTFTFREGFAQPVARFLNMDRNKQVKSMRRLATVEGIQLALTGHRGYTCEYGKAMEHWR